MLGYAPNSRRVPTRQTGGANPTYFYFPPLTNTRIGSVSTWSAVLMA